MRENLLEIKDLSIAFKNEKKLETVVNHINLSVKQNETVCLVGESGSGKSVTSKAILQLLPKATVHYTSGEIIFSGIDLLTENEQRLNAVRGKDISIIFQDSLTALNPVMRIGRQMVEIIRLHHAYSQNEAYLKAVDFLERVRIKEPQYVMKQYPFQLSGGMRQRVMIALALASRPKLLIADEPTTALDILVQKEILELVFSLQKELQMAILFITHDLSVVHEYADRVYIMEKGNIVEQGSRDRIFYHPEQPYTKQLLNSIPRIT